MLRRFHIGSVVNHETYVCRACRHKRLLSRRQQWRYQSTETTTNPDNWIDNFNNLTVDFRPNASKAARLSRRASLVKSSAQAPIAATSNGPHLETHTGVQSQKSGVGASPARASSFKSRRQRRNKAAQRQKGENERNARPKNIGADGEASAGPGLRKSMLRAFSTHIADAVEDHRPRSKIRPSKSNPMKSPDATTVAHQLRDVPIEKEEIRFPVPDHKISSNGDGSAEQDERLPLDTSGRDKKPPFEETRIRIYTSTSILNPTAPSAKLSLARRAEASNTRPGWAGLDTGTGTGITHALSNKDDVPPGGEQAYDGTNLGDETLTRKDAQTPVHGDGTTLARKKELDLPNEESMNTNSRKIVRQRHVESEQSKRAQKGKKRIARKLLKKETRTPLVRKPGMSSSPSVNTVTETWLESQKSTDSIVNGRGKTTTSKSSKISGKQTGKESDHLSTPGPMMATIRPREIKLVPLSVPQPPVPSLQHGLDRVLFNQGVYQLQDSRSRVYNFDPYLQKIMPVMDFDFHALKQYQTSSQDEALLKLADLVRSKYLGSTSSMTSTLSHFHFLLSNFRPLEMSMLSRGFTGNATTFTKVNHAPNAIFLRWQNGTYAIDADKEHDGANVLMLLGKSMEKLLMLSPSDFERYRKENSAAISREERDAPESFNYTTQGDFLMRSQLDAYDPRLPGSGMFDLKTRAVVSVRMDTEDFQPMSDYEIFSLQGRFESYEREYYDMIRATMLKYMLQVRMGRMDGIFVAYHNVKRIFGFQYISLEEMDRAIHGQTDRCLGDQEFQASLHLLNQVLDRATAKFPEKSLRFHFETRQENIQGVLAPVMWVYAEPMSEKEIDSIQNTNKDKIAEWERTAMGIEPDESVSTDCGPLFAKAEDQSDQYDQGPLFASKTEATLFPKEPDAKKQALQNDTEASDISDEVAEPQEEVQATSRPADTTSSSKERPTSPYKAKNPLGFASNKVDGNFKPLFVASIMIKSTVDGEPQDRPSSLRPDDTWEIEYLIQEWEADANWWARYEETKARRREALTNERDVDEEVAKEAVSATAKDRKRSDGYIRFMRVLSERGKEFRTKMDALEEGVVPIVVGQPIPEK